MPLTKDIIDNPKLWRLSLLISDTALHVLAHPTVGDADPICESLPLECDADCSIASAVEEAVYANPMLLLPFGKIDIVVRTPRFHIVPPEVAAESDALDALFDVFNPGDGRFERFVSHIDSRNSAVMLIEKTLANFLTRTFDTAKPQHVLATLGRYLSSRSRLGNTAKMFVDLGESSMDILVFNSYGLAAANSFSCPDINDAAYYALAVGRTAGLDLQNAEVLISGNSDRRAALTPLLRRFVNYVMPAIFPSAAYHGSPKVLKSPFPLVILPLCE